MKSFFKKSVISMFVMGLASTAIASHHGYANQPWSPSYTGFFIGVEGLDLRPENGDLDYVTAFPSSSAGSFYTDNISTDYQWSWRFFGGIKFTDNDDITLSWLRMRANDSDSSGFPISGPDTAQPRWLNDDNWTSVNGHVNFNLDEIYGVWGHSIHFNNPWSVRFAAGVEYAKINSDMSVTASNFGSEIEGVGFQADSHFRGFGPRAEFDMTYHLPSNFALFANFNAALLVSTRKVSSVAIESDEDLTDLTSSYFSTRHVVVPKFGSRLGASYTWIFGQAGGEGCGGVSALTIDAGWQVDSYIHAIERPEFGFGELETLTQTQFEGFGTTKVSNFGDQGFFIGLKYDSGVV